MDVDILYNLKSMGYLIMVQVKQILVFWVSGIVVGAIIAVYGENVIFKISVYVSKRKVLFLKLIFTAVLGAISPITIYGMLPILLLLAHNKINQGILASFTVTSVLINPNVFIYSFVLGIHIAFLRLIVCILAGVAAGLLVNAVYKNEYIFSLKHFEQLNDNKQVKKDIALFLNKIKKSALRTVPNLFIGILLAAVFQLYFPKKILNYFFAYNRGLSVLLSASLGVSAYYCGGGTIPLIKAWMMEGMSIGSAMAFMISGPATKITNLSAIKLMLSAKKFMYYILYIIIFSIVTGLLVDIITGLIM